MYQDYQPVLMRFRATAARAAACLCCPTHALPVDVFRVLVGVLSSAYFFHLFAQVADFSGPDGLIDHELTRQLFWYTKLGFFGPGISAAAFKFIFLAAAIASWALVIGYRVKPIAAALFAIAVSAYRWNFLVIYVDDAIMHLVLFWLLLLPVGRTLVLSEWLEDRQGAIERWKSEMVPGGPVRCFIVNLALVYVVAGLWKWTSPMWRDGTALYAALRMPVSYTPDFWRPEHLPMLRIANYGAMTLEPILPVMFVLPTNHRLKWALLAAAVGFHLGIVATMMMPYANLACIAAVAIVFRHEIMARLAGAQVKTSLPQAPLGAGWCTGMSLAFVLVLTLAVTGEMRVPSWRFPSRQEKPVSAGNAAVDDSRIALAGATIIDEATDGRVGFMHTEHNVFYTPLWFIGIAQSYRLFDWIDDRNFHAHYEVTERRADGSLRRVDPRELFPPSLRAVLLQGYLHDVTWGRVPRSRSREFKSGLFTRFANRFCRAHPVAGQVEVRAQVERISHDHATAPGKAELMMLFDCNGGKSALLYPHLQSASSLATAR